MRQNSHPMSHRRSIAVLAASVASAVTLAGCGSSSSTTTTTTIAAQKPVVGLSTPALRERYVALVATNDAQFKLFATHFRALGPLATNLAMRGIAEPARLELQRTALSLNALRGSADKVVSRDLVTLVQNYNVVYQGLGALESGYGSRAFNFGGWVTAFESALGAANSNESKARKDLGLPVRH
jgi:hypothetical protein